MRMLIFKASLLTVSLALCAGVAEVVLRAIIGPPLIWRFPQEQYIADAEIGASLVPSQTSFTHSETVRVNSHGLRDRDYQRRASPGTRRILALGDSQTFGNGLALQDSWPKQLERELAARQRTTKWQVLNGGIPGTSPWQHEILLKRLKQVYEFDAVILGFYVNDVTLTPPQIVRRTVATDSAARRAAYFLKRSALLTALWQQRWLLQRLLGGGDYAVRTERNIIVGAPDPAIERAWQDAQTALVGMKSQADDLGIELILMVMPRSDQVDETLSATAYNRRIATIGRKNRIPVVDMLNVLREEYQKSGNELFITWDGHNSALANRVMAGELARRIIELIGQSESDTVGGAS